MHMNDMLLQNAVLMPPVFVLNRNTSSDETRCKEVDEKKEDLLSVSHARWKKQRAHLRISSLSIGLDLDLLASIPTMSISPLLIKVLLKRNTGVPNAVILSPVLVAVLKDQTNI